MRFSADVAEKRLKKESTASESTEEAVTFRRRQTMSALLCGVLASHFLLVMRRFLRDFFVTWALFLWLACAGCGLF